ncbi:MAG: type II toxin-antitoxin system HicB family antitoxin [Candidatus Limnocylindria bacterium]
MRYAVVIEKTGNGYAAYVPDLPGCIAAADTRAETEALIASAIQAHLELMRESGDPIPRPTSWAHQVGVT